MKRILKKSPLALLLILSLIGFDVWKAGVSLRNRLFGASSDPAGVESFAENESAFGDWSGNGGHGDGTSGGGSESTESGGLASSGSGGSESRESNGSEVGENNGPEAGESNGSTSSDSGGSESGGGGESMEENSGDPFTIRFAPRPPSEPRSDYYSDPGKTPLTTAYPYAAADDSYFDDALFIGDSRVEGLFYYANLPNADFMYKTGLMVFNMMTDELDNGETSATLPDWLRSHSYGKIFIMSGINELGFITENYAEQYEKNIAEIGKLQPQAEIILLAILNVTKAQSDGSEIINNDNINAKNCAIAERISGRRIFYMDMNEAVCDENGYLNADYTSDGVHLYAQYDYLLIDWLKAHAILPDAGSAAG